MAANPWLALDGGEPSERRERELRRVWEHYFEEGTAEEARLPIAESWRRSAAAGLDPVSSRAPTVLADRREVESQWEAHPLESVTPLIRRWLLRLANDTGHLIVVSDADGMLLRIEGDVRLRSAAADAMNFAEGTLWSEASAGTNAVGSALAVDHPIQVHGPEHFSAPVHAWTCSAAPVHDPEDGRLLGIIDLTSLTSHADAETAAAVLATARAVEAELRVRMQLRDARLRLQHLDAVTSGSRKLALVSSSGRVIADDPDGFLGTARLEIPPGDDGIVVVGDGRLAVAERVDETAFLVHEIDTPAQLAGRRTPRELDAWRRSQLELSKLAEEQAALRRVAMLVAGTATPDEIFTTVSEEVSRLLRADATTVVRYEPDDAIRVLSVWGARRGTVALGTRLGVEPESVAASIRSSGQPGRLDDYAGVEGPLVQASRDAGYDPKSTVGAPILVDGRVWGAILATSTGAEPVPEDAEARLAGFAELVATAIANAVARAELDASRARLVTAGDDARRRIERDLHDGLQQRLVSLAVQLSAAGNVVPAEADELREQLVRASEDAVVAIEELREIAHGIHPAVLSRHGLGAALRVLARRSELPVDVVLETEIRYPDTVESAAYYVAAEALTNAAKHAGASSVRVTLAGSEEALHLSVHDDGNGGADASGSGLVGLRDRVEALGGTLVVESPDGEGTRLRVSIPREP